MIKPLSTLCSYADGRIAVSDLNLENYISTENMLPNKEGIVRSAGLPSISQTQAYQADDVLVSNIRPYFKKIWLADRDGGCSNDVLVLRASKDAYPSFLYYLLSDDNFFEYATATAKGTKMPRGDKGAIMRYEVPILPFDMQVNIADMLAVLDSKIANNTKTNHHLEQIAQAVYVKQFGLREPNGVLGDYCTVKSGYAFKSSWWQENGVKVIKIKNITNTGLDLSDCSFVSDDKIAYAKDFIACAGDLLIAMTGATIGKFAIVPHSYEVLLVNQRVGKFFFNGDSAIEQLPFLWCSLKQDSIFNEIVSRGQGSAQPNISPTDIISIPIFMPSVDELKDFNMNLQSSFESMIANIAENVELAKLRDLLIPKLISRELCAK